ncbi:hypothetical protein BDF21DRAFT_429913 [Thamnidium elegans]|uniref:Uncharacterized protein n=1 Tax=Thamnidium elegans TaxID=101142 RepID=A0A8H7SYG6_9FUNG|nr:hypothetical protein INT48_006932 [Thamnidium elegans]KAI8058738.1 hypothetical protein BDF21DRAFT_429913 [Thamnidium elegans]
MSHVPYLSEEEQLFLNTTATYSKARRMSSSTENTSRPVTEDNLNTLNNRRHQVVSVSSLSFLWKRRGSSSSSLVSSSSSRSIDIAHQLEEDPQEDPQSPKAKELELLIFDQPQRTVRLSLTPRCAV